MSTFLCHIFADTSKMKKVDGINIFAMFVASRPLISFHSKVRESRRAKCVTLALLLITLQVILTLLHAVIQVHVNVLPHLFFKEICRSI